MLIGFGILFGALLFVLPCFWVVGTVLDHAPDEMYWDDYTAPSAPPMLPGDTWSRKVTPGEVLGDDGERLTDQEESCVQEGDRGTA